MFSVHTTPEEFGYVFEENSGREWGRGREGEGRGREGGEGVWREGVRGREGNHMITAPSSFSKCFLSTLKRTAGGFEESFRKAPFP